MHIETVVITNYKSFLDRQTFHFEPGFNLLVGTNNAGKTTVLDVMDLDFTLNEPHRSELTIPVFGGQPLGQSEFEVTLATRFNELRQLVGSSQVYLPLAASMGNLTETMISDHVRAFADDDRELRLVSRFGHSEETVTLVGDDLIHGTGSRRDGTPLSSVLLQYTPDGPKPKTSVGNMGGASQRLGEYGQSFKSRIYRFHAQRRRVRSVVHRVP